MATQLSPILSYDERRRFYNNNPYFPMPPVNPIPYRRTDDPKKALDDERARATARGDILEQEYRDVVAPEYGQYQRYRRAGDEVYRPILEGRGGYLPGEIPGLLQEDYLSGLQLTPQEYGASFLTPDEQRAMLGDPYAARERFRPEQQYQIAREGGQRERELRGEATPRIRETYMDPALLMSPEFAAQQRGTLGGMYAGVRGAFDPQALSLSEGFAERYPMSDVEVQEFGDLGARMASERFRGLFDAAQRQGGAAGTPSLATAALQGRLERQAGISAADAGTTARLQALAAQRDQMLKAEQERLGSERFKAGLGTDIEFGLTDRALATQDAIERLKLQAALDRANLGVGAEQDLLAQGLASERGIGERMLDTGRWAQETGIGLEQYGESEAARRAAERAVNRQGIQQYVQGQRYGRGMDIGDALYGRRRDVAQERLGQEREGREYLRGAQQQAGDFYTRGADRRVQGMDVTGRGSLGAAGTLADYRAARKASGNWFTRNVLPLLNTEAASKAAGAYF